MLTFRAVSVFLLLLPCSCWGQTAVAAPSVSPGAIVAGTPTIAVVTALIISSGPAVLTNGVNLLQVDQNGNNARVVGTLNDDGLNGDPLAGDGIFGGIVTLNQMTPGQVYLQVSAAFSGVLRRTLSPVVAVIVTPPGMPISPAAPTPSLVTTDPATNNLVVCNELLVAFQPSVTSSNATSLITASGGRLVGLLPGLGIYQVGYSTCDFPSLNAARARLLANPLVLSADFDNVSSLSQVTSGPNDHFLLTGEQWYLPKINMAAGWAAAQTAGVSRGATIGVLDSGVDSNHEDLIGHVIPGFNWCPSLDANNNCTGGSTTNTSDDIGHGTAVAGLAAAVSNNGIGVASPAFNALVIAERVASPTVAIQNNNVNIVTDSAVANGIYDAIAVHSAKVLNMSFNPSIAGQAGTSCSKTLLSAIQYAASRNVVIVASSGNSHPVGNDVRQCPAAYSVANANVISVGASDSNDHRASFSNYGSWVTLYGPGVGMWVLLNGIDTGLTGYGYYEASPESSSGTSFSAPLVTGTVSLMLAAKRNLSPGVIKTLLACSADAIGKDPDNNAMVRLNAGKAVLYASLGYTTCPQPQPQYTITDLGVLGPAQSGTAAYGINNNDQVVGSSFVGQLGGTGGLYFEPVSYPFLWSNGTMTNLGFPPGACVLDAAAYGINDNGQVVGSAWFPDGYCPSYAFIYTGGVMSLINGLGGAGLAINNSGQVVGNFAGGIYNSSTSVITPLPTLGGSGSIGYGINNTNQIVGLSYLAGDQSSHAFLYTGTLLKDLGTLGGLNSLAKGINNAGQIVGAADTGTGARHAFSSHGAALVDLGTLGGTNSQADGLNSSGQIVGWANVGNGDQHAFVYNNGTMTDLNTLVTLLQGVFLVEATGINDSGKITANGSDGRAYLLTPR